MLGFKTVKMFEKTRPLAGVWWSEVTSFTIVGEYVVIPLLEFLWSAE